MQCPRVGLDIEPVDFAVGLDTNLDPILGEGAQAGHSAYQRPAGGTGAIDVSEFHEIVLRVQIPGVDGDEDSAPGKISRTLRSENLNARVGPDNALQGFEAIGSVVMTETDPEADTSRTLRADRVNSKIGADSSLEQFNAFGNVIFEQDDTVARGDRLLWDVKGDVGTLTGAPVQLEMGRNHLTGDKIEFAQRGGRIRITSKTRVEATLVGADRKLLDVLP